MSWYDVWTVFWRDWLVLRRRLVKFILSRMVAPVLYMTAFGWGLGRSIDIGGGSYLDFIVPGILALNSMNISFNSVTPVHAERIYHKSLEEYILAPITPAAFVVGKLLAATLRSLISSAIIVALAIIFGATLHLTPLVVLVLVLNSLIFAGMGFVCAMKINTYEEMGQVNTYILLPMSFLCGTFFRADTLPVGIYYLVKLLPLTYASEVLRSLSVGGEVLWTHVAILGVFAAFCFFLAVRSFEEQWD